jgi:hypothetical protein
MSDNPESQRFLEIFLEGLKKLFHWLLVLGFEIGVWQDGTGCTILQARMMKITPRR